MCCFVLLLFCFNVCCLGLLICVLIDVGGLFCFGDQLLFVGLGLLLVVFRRFNVVITICLGVVLLLFLRVGGFLCFGDFVLVVLTDVCVFDLKCGLLCLATWVDWWFYDCFGLFLVYCVVFCFLIVCLWFIDLLGLVVLVLL